MQRRAHQEHTFEQKEASNICVGGKGGGTDRQRSWATLCRILFLLGRTFFRWNACRCSRFCSGPSAWLLSVTKLASVKPHLTRNGAAVSASEAASAEAFCQA